METTKIYVTQDYSKFSLANYGLNRIVPETKVIALIKEIERINLLRHFPIIVNRDFLIIDGQTRFLAARKLNIPIYYTISNELNIHDAPKINFVQKSWTVTDYVNHYAITGVHDYQILQKLHLETEISLTPLASLLMKSVIYERGFSSSIINKGLFKVLHEDFTILTISYAKDFSKFNNFQYWRSRKFLAAVSKLAKSSQYSHELMLHKLSIVPYLLENKVSAEDFLKMLNDIYNFKSPATKKIIFS